VTSDYFKPLTDKGEPRVFIGTYRPPFHELSARLRDELVAAPDGRLFSGYSGRGATAMREAWQEGAFDVPMYRDAEVAA
jgi:hypothetical protein